MNDYFKISLKPVNYFLFLVFFLISSGCSDTSVIQLTDPSKIIEEPIQEEIPGKSFKFKKGLEHFTIHQKATYKIAARVLRIKKYSGKGMNSLVPYDFALGWGPMADLKFLHDIDISIGQGHRTYYWRVPDMSKTSRQTIEFNSANVHLLYVDFEIRKQLENIKKNDYIYLEGFLVDVEAPEGNFHTSMKRTDTGAGSCEIFLITKVLKIQEP